MQPKIVKKLHPGILRPGQKPVGPVVLDRAHPLARGLVGCYLFNEGAGEYTRNLADGSLAQVPKLASNEWAVRNGFVGRNCQNSSLTSTTLKANNNSQPNPKLNTVSAYSVYIRATLDNIPNWSRFWQKEADLSGTRSFSFGKAYTTNVFRLYHGDTDYIGWTASVGTPALHDIIITWDGASANFILDGQPQGAQAFTIVPPSGDGLFVVNQNGGYGPTQGHYIHCFHWNRALSVEEAVQITRDPYQIILPETNYFYIPVSTGGVTINATKDSLGLTTYPANVKLNVSILATKESLGLTTYPANVKLNVSILATKESLGLTTYPAEIKLSQNVSAGTQTLPITTYAASVTLGVNIDATKDSLGFTVHQANVTGEKQKHGGGAVQAKKKPKKLFLQRIKEKEKKEIPDYLERILNPPEIIESKQEDIEEEKEETKEEK